MKKIETVAGSYTCHCTSSVIQLSVPPYHQHHHNHNCCCYEMLMQWLCLVSLLSLCVTESVRRTHTETSILCIIIASLYFKRAIMMSSLSTKHLTAFKHNNMSCAAI